MSSSSNDRRKAEVVLLTNFIPPYRLPVLMAIADRIKNFAVWISTPMEENRPWTAEYADLEVKLQRTLSFGGWWRHPSGFRERTYIHLPYDTLVRLLREKPTVVFSVELGFRTIQAAIYRKLVSNSRLVIWADVSTVTEAGRGRFRDTLRRVVIKTADVVVVNGASGARYVRGLGVAPERINIIPYTTEVASFSKTRIQRCADNSYKLLYCGQLIERKGLLSFLDVLSTWAERHPDRTIAMSIVGEGKIEAHLRGLQLPTNVSLDMQPSVAYQKIPELYSRHGILVLPTLADTWGLVVNEALASGMPVLGSVFSQAVEEMVQHGVNGWVFDPSSPAEMYEAISTALDTPLDELRKMRIAARQSALSITPGSVAEQVATLATKVRNKRSSQKVAILTNIIAPYKLPIYERLASWFDTVVLTASAEDNRRHWSHIVPHPRIRSVKCWGLSKKIIRSDKQRIYDLSYLHITIGYVPALIRLRPQAIITSELGFRTVVSLVFGWLTGVPVWVWWGGTVHTERNRGLARRLTRRLLSKAVKHWISYGISSTQYLLHLGVDRSVVVQVQNCVDGRLFSPSSKPRLRNGEVRLLYVGQLIQRKGVHHLIRACGRLQARRTDFSLQIVGDGPEEATLREMCGQLGLAQISFTASVQPAEMRALYHSADCLVFPTLEEVWGLVVNEAIMSGLPVVCSKFAGCAHELLPTECIFDPTDDHAFDDILERALAGAIAEVDPCKLMSPEQVGDAIARSIAGKLCQADNARLVTGQEQSPSTPSHSIDSDASDGSRIQTCG